MSAEKTRKNIELPPVTQETMDLLEELGNIYGTRTTGDKSLQSTAVMLKARGANKAARLITSLFPVVPPKGIKRAKARQPGARPS